MHITFGTGAGAPVPQPLTIACSHANCHQPGAEAGEARLFQKKVQIVKRSKQFSKTVQIQFQNRREMWRTPHRSAGRSPERGKTEKQLLTWAIEDGAQGNIKIYENIRT